MKSRLRLSRTIFLLAFIISTLLFFFVLYFFQSPVSSAPPDPGSSSGSTEDFLYFFIPLFTSVVSFLGFVITSVLSFHREKREVRETELSQKIKEIELERARLELEQLKTQVNKKKK